uniref:Uncharacterized protein n=1 Tax=Leptocylindrus danicus TaxID=163516 RepID=A0A7S2L8M3_9STRA|mmetsp:Transcript_33401/g.48347  ORF Transcript_33401/g.48347 Transcript_33401/m.48347 type:complete len:320 (+) Transcript_33401:3-962(+)
MNMQLPPSKLGLTRTNNVTECTAGSDSSEHSFSTDYTQNTNSTAWTYSTYASTDACISSIAGKLYGLRYQRGQYRFVAGLLASFALISAIIGNFHCSFALQSGVNMIGIWMASNSGDLCYTYTDTFYIDFYMKLARIGSISATFFGCLSLCLLWFSIFLTERMIKLTVHIFILSMICESLVFWLFHSSVCDGQCVPDVGANLCVVAQVFWVLCALVTWRGMYLDAPANDALANKMIAIGAVNVRDPNEEKQERIRHVQADTIENIIFSANRVLLGPNCAYYNGQETEHRSEVICSGKNGLGSYISPPDTVFDSQNSVLC